MNTIISWKNKVKDVIIVISDDFTFNEYNRTTVASSKKILGWILWTFETKKVKPAMMFFKALMLSPLEYYCIDITFQGGENCIVRMYKDIS